MHDEVIRTIGSLSISSEDAGDEVMRIIDALPISSTDAGFLVTKLEDQNERIEKLKVEIKRLTGAGGSPEHLYQLQRQLDVEFDQLDEMLNEKLELHSRSLHPTNIIHLATTEEEDKHHWRLCAQHDDGISNQSTISRQSSHQRVLSRECSAQSQQRKVEKKFEKIQKKLLELCSNDIGRRSSKQSSCRNAQNNLSDDIKQQFDVLYAELGMLQKELFHNDGHGDNQDFDSFENSEEQKAYQTLKQQNAMLIEQGDHFQVLFKEQQLEIESYRKKYMQALQSVMEQHVQITSMESVSECTEKKALETIVGIKNNLRKKLDHLAPMSNMLETSNSKLIHTIKKRAELEQNYQNICDELRQLKKDLSHSSDATYKAKSLTLVAELKKLKELNEFNTKRESKLQLQLQQAKSELERVTVTSNKTIKSAMKKYDFLRSELNSRINELEIELVQSRAIHDSKLKIK